MARRAKATAELLKQVNQTAPERNISSDGWIGDAAHRRRKSDHNPNSAGVVQAQDITHDPRGGFDSYEFAETLRTKQDKRIKNVISNRKIFAGPAGPSPWKWRAYGGKNPHDQHVHVSVADEPSLYDDESPWDLGGSGAGLLAGISNPLAPEKTLPVMRRGDKGFYVELVQTRLGLPDVDGDFGTHTYNATRQFQRDHKLDDDGVVGNYTWRELLRPWAREVKLVPEDPRGKLYQMAIAAKQLGPDASVDDIVKAFIIIVEELLPPGFTLQPPTPELEPEPPPESPPPGFTLVSPTPEPGPEPLPESPPESPPEPVKEYHAIVKGGFYADDPYDKKVPTAIRCNNPGALNTSKAVQAIPGYNTAIETTPGNKTAVFWAPEYGVLAYWDLLDRYRVAGAKTVGKIINKYGGGQNYSAYLNFVVKTTGLPASYEIKIDGSDDVNLMKFAKAMFRYEAGRETPLSDDQIRCGFGLGRERNEWRRPRGRRRKSRQSRQ
jgi:peptidoglycan hydrolase-like protein with peptidoglycan-binding domain